MSANRPMSEHEAALFDAVVALAATMLELGADGPKLQARLSAARDAAGALGNHRSVETMEFLIRSIFLSQPGTPRPTLRIV